jgi:2-amino-4-hydroxy-6-hydroxymethyldihydropteridine diphosphokinase
VRSVPNAARLLDLDMIAYHDLQMATPLVTLPHPRLTDRAFVLKPMADIAPAWCHPVTGESLSVLISRLSPEQMAVPLGQGWSDD